MAAPDLTERPRKLLEMVLEMGLVTAEVAEAATDSDVSAFNFERELMSQFLTYSRLPLRSPTESTESQKERPRPCWGPRRSTAPDRGSVEERSRADV